MIDNSPANPSALMLKFKSALLSSNSTGFILLNRKYYKGVNVSWGRKNIRVIIKIFYIETAN